ncbi:MAG: type II toxin-antitoxin system VapC family toxin [Verrucomicrobiales bacterium]|nr:type II toxin-antitoxin system VapC family toxin [Verrucomicrobiales bacterium]
MYLLDTNVWLEHLLSQTRAPEVVRLLTEVDSTLLSISHFSLHSIGVILGRRQRSAALDQFVRDLFEEGQVVLRTVFPGEFPSVCAAMQSQGLDFDDAYQYVIARRDGLTLVSFDADFDRTNLQRQTPAQVLAAPPPPTGGAQT